MVSNTLLNQVIGLKELSLHIVEMPQKSRFRSGIGSRLTRKALLIRWEDPSGTVGYGECACRQDPYYSAEHLDGVVGLIRKFVIPHLKPTQTYQELLGLLRKIRGWNFAKAAVESSAFQVARLHSGYDLATDIISNPIQEVPVGISLGIYEDKQAIQDAVIQSMEAGYRRLKFKIAPFVDTTLFDFINPLLLDNQVYVSFDANGSYTAGDLDALEYFIHTYDTVIEQPFAPDRYDVLQVAKGRFPALQVCFDEEVKSIGDLVKLHALGAVDELNLKIGRVGGLSNSIQIVNFCHRAGIPCWVGGMFETGIGRILNLELAAFLPGAKAHDLSPSQRYFEEDIVLPNVEMKEGHIAVAAARKSVVSPELIEKYTVEKFVYKIT